MDEIEKAVLEKLTFAESLSSILEEVDGERNVITDVLKLLIRKGWVVTVEDRGSHLSRRQIYYDSDHMETYSYIITALGLKQLGH